MNDMNKDLEWIKKFAKITVAGVCSDLKIDKSNLWCGKASEFKIAEVKKEIQKRLKEL